MKIRIFSHDEAVWHAPIGRTAMIRLLDSPAMLEGSTVRNEPLRHEKWFQKVFDLTVDDIQRSLEEEYPGSVLFSEEHARFLQKAFLACEEMDEVIVHCRAGVSRSSAVAILFARHLKRLDLECSLYLNHNIFPNRHILSFQSFMGIPEWTSEIQPTMKRLEQQVMEGDHESICQSVNKLGFNWEEIK